MQFTKCRIVCALILSAALIVTSVSSAHAQATDTSKTTPAATGQTLADTNLVRSVGGFVDAYYAWDFNRPHNFDRAYTTQPARHAEANVNLAYIETKWSGSRYYTPTKAVTLTYDKAARELPDDRRLHWNRCEPLWRTELRGFHSKDPVWPLHTAGDLSRNDAFFVSSLALTFRANGDTDVEQAAL